MLVPLVERSEIALARRLAGLRDHPLLRSAEPLSKLADQPPMVALAAAGVLAGLTFRNPRLAQAGGRMLASVLLATGGKSVIKRLVRRTRPNVVLDEGRYRAEAGGSEEKSEQSFPSGHTADAVAAARAIARSYPNLALPAYTTAAAVAALQPARAKHYPTDVVAGAAIAVAAELIVDRLFRAAGLSASGR